MSLTIHSKYKCFDSTVQRAEDRRQKFHFCRLPFAVNVMLNLSNSYKTKKKFTGSYSEVNPRNLISVKDSVPRELRSRVIYKFTCACYNACYVGETGRHFSTCRRSSVNISLQTSPHTKLITLSSIFPCGLFGNL